MSIDSKYAGAAVIILIVIGVVLYFSIKWAIGVVSAWTTIAPKVIDKFRSQPVETLDLTEYNKELKKFQLMTSDEQARYLKLTRAEKLASQ